MTDNRTNEELAERLRQFAESQAMDFDSPYTAMMLNEVADRLVAAQGATPAQPSNGADEDVLSAVRAERDAALARIAELEAELEVAMRPHSECERSGAEAGERIVDLEGDLAGAEARIAEAAKLHRKYAYYEHEDSCPDTNEEHRENHHHESDDIGEFYCDQMPTGDVCCDNCRDVNGDRMEWPCPTAVSLGLNEGENDD